MTWGARLGLMICAYLVTAPVSAQALYLDGYSAGRALAELHRDGDREEFVRGVLAGLNASGEGAVSDEAIRDARSAWYADPSLSKRDRASYAAGYLSAETHNSPQALYSRRLYVQGLLDSLQNPGSPYIEKLAGSATVSRYQRTLFYQKKREVADRIKANERSGKAFLADNAGQPGVIESDSGLQYRVISPGQGPRPTPKDTVVVSLTGRKIDGQVFYDSGREGSGPTTLRVNQTLQGWQEALVNMSAGAEWELFLPPQLAYGNSGWQGVVEPGEAIIYRLKLVKIASSE